MTITARFASRCPRCDQQITVGIPINWERGKPATHTVCQPLPSFHCEHGKSNHCSVDGVPLTEPLRIPVDQVGVYVLPDGTIVKVQPNQEKTRTYAKRWTVINGQRLTEADTRVKGEYVFEPGLVQQVAAEGRKMTLEEAKAFILRYGQCCRCSAKLKDAKSVERGIGPVCVKYFEFGG